MYATFTPDAEVEREDYATIVESDEYGAEIVCKDGTACHIKHYNKRIIFIIQNTDNPFDDEIISIPDPHYFYRQNFGC